MPPPSPIAKEAASARQKSIVIIEDDELSRMLYARILSARGYTIKHCGRGDQALALLRLQPPDLVLLDTELADTSGMDLLKEIRNDSQIYDIPVVLISALATEEVIETGVSLGADDYVIKPVKAAELVARVAMVMRKRALVELRSAGFTYGGLFGGRYEVVGTLGTGGYGTVYLAHDTRCEESDSRVALKAFHVEKTKRSYFVPRFLRETYAHTRLAHPNIVKLIDFGHQESIYFLVMEYLDGLNLEQVKLSMGQLDETTAVTVAYEIAKALEHLYRHKTIHRDIKLRNIMVTHDGDIKLLDFGMARQVMEDTLSAEEFVGGTPDFISPEYINSSENLDIRSDVYSLGMTLYFALSDRLPFPDGKPMELILRHLETARQPLREVAPHISREFAGLIDRMVSRDRDKRPTTAALLDELGRHMMKEGVTAELPPPPAPARKEAPRQAQRRPLRAPRS